MLWVDKVRRAARVCAGTLPRARARTAPASPPPAPLPQYRPGTFDKFTLHKDIADNLKKLVRLG
jgi:hypothetical protein